MLTVPRKNAWLESKPVSVFEIVKQRTTLALRPPCLQVIVGSLPQNPSSQDVFVKAGYRCRSIVPENPPCLRHAEGPVAADPYGVIIVDSVISPKTPNV
jgi:hypothetical protein